MDWIEQIFHVDPDGGDGVMEVAILLFVALAILVTVVKVRGWVAPRNEGAETL